VVRPVIPHVTFVPELRQYKQQILDLLQAELATPEESPIDEAGGFGSWSNATSVTAALADGCGLYLSLARLDVLTTGGLSRVKSGLCSGATGRGLSGWECRSGCRSSAQSGPWMLSYTFQAPAQRAAGRQGGPRRGSGAIRKAASMIAVGSKVYLRGCAYGQPGTVVRIERNRAAGALA